MLGGAVLGRRPGLLRDPVQARFPSGRRPRLRPFL